MRREVDGARHQHARATAPLGSAHHPCCRRLSWRCRPPLRGPAAARSRAPACLSSQVALNCGRRSTRGFSLDNVLLDVGGGLLSLGQMLLSCAAERSWAPLAGNSAKVGLGLCSIGFDCVFMLQVRCEWLHPNAGYKCRPLTILYHNQALRTPAMLSACQSLLECCVGSASPHLQLLLLLLPTMHDGAAARRASLRCSALR